MSCMSVNHSPRFCCFYCLEESIQKVCIVTKSFPRYFALVSRFRHEVMSVGPDGGVMASKVNPKVQAIFPAGSIKRSTKIHLQVCLFFHVGFYFTFTSFQAIII